MIYMCICYTCKPISSVVLSNFYLHICVPVSLCITYVCKCPCRQEMVVAPWTWVTSSGDTPDMDHGIHSQQQQQHINLRDNSSVP